MSSTPLMASSSGAITDFCTLSPDAPKYCVITITVGGAISGYCSIGKVAKPIIPSSPITTEITVESTGRSTNVFIPITVCTISLVSTKNLDD